MSNSMYSAAQLAEMCLSSLPTTRQAIDHKAKRENWFKGMQKDFYLNEAVNVLRDIK